jgi:uncharacterized SAM-binding protein YcdF (DUF218 family)
MNALTTELVHLLLAVPFWLICLLLVLSLRARHTDALLHLSRWRFVLPVVAVGLYVVSAPVFPNTLMRWIETRYAVPALSVQVAGNDRLIVVLTAGWSRATADGYDSKISEAGWERTWAAVQLWRRIGGTLLFTGAPTPDGRDSAAAGMARMARELGVPGQAILTEPASLSTYENFAYSQPLIERHGGEVWLITSALHMPRAMAVARKMGVTPIAYPCDFRAQERIGWWQWLPSNSGPVMFEKVLHELLGMLLYRLRGWI